MSNLRITRAALDHAYHTRKRYETALNFATSMGFFKVAPSVPAPDAERSRLLVARSMLNASGVTGHKELFDVVRDIQLARLYEDLQQAISILETAAARAEDDLRDS